MCVQCAASASVVVGTASGLRAWLAGRFSGIPARRLRAVTLALMGVAVLGSSIGFGGA